MKIIQETAARFLENCTVEWESAYSTVTISTKGEEDIFMQGEDAETFINQIEKLCEDYPDLDEETAAACLAEPYTMLWE